jgi:mandelate racemase
MRPRPCLRADLLLSSCALAEPIFIKILQPSRQCGRLPDQVRLMVDFNQALTFSDAMKYALALDVEGVYWIEEPIRHDDYLHMALIAQAAKTPIQIGENFAGLPLMAADLAAGASDYVMLDLDRIGGVTGWQRAAGLAAAYNREVSSHLFPEVSAHLLAATPGRHWLEYVDWANSILQEPNPDQGRHGHYSVPRRQRLVLEHRCRRKI